MNDNIKQMAEIVLKTCEEYYRTKCCKECADFEAIALDAAGYRKQSNAEIDRIIREGKMKLNDAMRDSLNIAMGERNTDIAQAWQNGYDKGKSDTSKEFAEKIYEWADDAEKRINEDCTARDVYDAIQEVKKVAASFGGEEKK